MDPALLHQLSLWTGRLAVVLLVFNFTTCFVMPWARNRLPWRGSRPGSDKKDSFGNFQFTAVHKAFAWGTIVTVALHVVAVIVAAKL